MHEPRQARQFGYGVSPGPAIATEGGREFAAVLRRQPTLIRQAGVRVGLKAAAIWIPFELAVYLGGGALKEVALAMVGAFVLSALVGAIALRRKVSRSRVWTEKAVKVVGEHPWQVWPCRVEEADPEGSIQPRYVVPSFEWRDLPALATPVFVRVMLLAPDGSVARTYASRIPEYVWHSLTDGLAALWICGDLRFEIVLATPGAQNCWLGTPLPAPTTRPAAREDADDIGVIAREAGSWAVSQWLG
ncbi:hypothetical protein [Yinghuangia sp. YIM S09857]|uniref:hypothetical protein n=1 Tax=Yinghuangia sp. YIM S09857 TaxID=3436929 RepID=UPI003F5392E5